jgi:hypothetical protein
MAYQPQTTPGGNGFLGGSGTFPQLQSGLEWIARNRDLKDNEIRAFARTYTDNAVGTIEVPTVEEDPNLPGTAVLNALGNGNGGGAVAGGGLYVTVEEYGAEGDGVADDTEPIRAALSNPGGLPVYLTPGRRYVVTGRLEVPSRGVFNGNGATIVVPARISELFYLHGSADDTDVPTAQNYDRGAATLTTTAAHNLTKGETFRIVGQRLAASIDAPLDDRLGMATGDTNGPYFAEYLTVREVVSPTEVELSAALIFNGYRTDKTQETHPQARDRTTVNRINWHERAVIANVVIEGDTAQAVSMGYCKDAVLHNIRDHKTGSSGSLVSIRGSYRCIIDRCHGEYQGNRPESVLFYNRNFFKIISSQSCVVQNCTSEGGAQIVDATYLQSYRLPCIATVIRGNIFHGYDDNGVTIHPGCWGSMIVDNDFRAYNNGTGTSNVGTSGIGVRSPRSVISGNLIHGSPARAETDPMVSGGSYGVHLFSGGGSGCTVSNNQIEGQDWGVAISDEMSFTARHGTLDVLITGNHIKDTYFGVLQKKYFNSANRWSALSILTNHITSKINGAVGIQIDYGGGMTRAPILQGNAMHFSGTNPVPIRLGQNTKTPAIIGNTVTGTATYLYQTQPDAANGTIALSGNVVVNGAGVTPVVTMYPGA